MFQFDKLKCNIDSLMNMIITIMILIIVKERVVLKWGIRSVRGTVIYTITI